MAPLTQHIDRYFQTAGEFCPLQLLPPAVGDREASEVRQGCLLPLPRTVELADLICHGGIPTNLGAVHGELFRESF